jgi:hypothetical protein
LELTMNGIPVWVLAAGRVGLTIVLLGASMISHRKGCEMMV